jgi:hypothetical protein
VRRSAGHTPVGDSRALFPAAVHASGIGPRGGEVTPDEQAYLCAIANTPTMTATERDRWLGIPVSTGHRRRATLQAKGYVRLVRVPTGHRGGPAVVTELTEQSQSWSATRRHG